MRRVALVLSFAVSLFTLFAAPVAAAQPDDGLVALETGDEARGWNAVGQLELGGHGFCTGSLIAPDLVLTAAHCVYDPISGKRMDPTQIHFYAGWRNGRAAAYRQIKRAVVHPDYIYSTRDSAKDVNYDLALLELDRPIRLPSIKPFAIGGVPTFGEQVGVVSYAKGRSQAPSLQKVCHVLGREKSMVVMTCSADFGASGAPVFEMRDGVAKVISVISAKARMRGKPVSLGIAVDGPLKVLRAELNKAENSRFLHAPAPGGTPLTERQSGGAKFVRP